VSCVKTCILQTIQTLLAFVVSVDHFVTAKYHLLMMLDIRHINSWWWQLLLLLLFFSLFSEERTLSTYQEQHVACRKIEGHGTSMVSVWSKVQIFVYSPADDTAILSYLARPEWFTFPVQVEAETLWLNECCCYCTVSSMV